MSQCSHLMSLRLFGRSLPKESGERLAEIANDIERVIDQLEADLYEADDEISTLKSRLAEER